MEAVVKKWGNSYGVRLTKKDLARLGLREGDAVDVGIRPQRGKIDVSDFPFIRDPRGAVDAVSVNHDEILYGHGRRRP